MPCHNSAIVGTLARSNKRPMKYFPAIVFLLLVSSCAPRLVGTWQISKYEEVNPGAQTSTFTNAGTMTLYKDLTGKNKVSFAGPTGTVTDTGTFSWKAEDGFVTMKRPHLPTAKTWIITEDKKNKQIWTTTDGGQKAIMMELTRIKSK